MAGPEGFEWERRKNGDVARLTGNYKRGNERSARQHPQNQGRR